jgi:uncharacterized phage protein (TIGR01671 family)
MRDILFRGLEKLSDDSFLNPKWVEGWLMKIRYESAKDTLFPTEGIYIHTTDYSLIRVEPNTIGEYTGIKDINEKRIFEGDIVRVTVISTSEFYKNAKIEFQDGNFMCVVKDGSDIGLLSGVSYAPYDTQVEIIGNMFETPELLEVCNG